MNLTSEIFDCWFLSGPTASGKTHVGLGLAERLDAEIISLDSMSVYRGMNIGTAKPTAEQQTHIRHHLIDIRDPDQRFSVTDYLEAAAEAITDIRSRGKQVLFVGGTPLYLKAMLRGMFAAPPGDDQFRAEVLREAEEVGFEALHARLQLVDPLSAARIHPHDVRRIVRALEVYRATGEPISHQQLQFDEAAPTQKCRVFVLQWPRSILHQRINERVARMFQSGLIDEVRGLLQRFGQLGPTARQAVGYREVETYLSNQASLDETIRKTQARTRQFAKRQMTWFRSLSECRWVARHEDRSVDQIIDQIVAAQDASAS